MDGTNLIGIGLPCYVSLRIDRNRHAGQFADTILLAGTGDVVNVRLVFQESYYPRISDMEPDCDLQTLAKGARHGHSLASDYLLRGSIHQDTHAGRRTGIA